MNLFWKPQDKLLEITGDQAEAERIRQQLRDTPGLEYARERSVSSHRAGRLMPDLTAISIALTGCASWGERSIGCQAPFGSNGHVRKHTQSGELVCHRSACSRLYGMSGGSNDRLSNR
jgi:hypothetical protein